MQALICHLNCGVNGSESVLIINVYLLETIEEWMVGLSVTHEVDKRTIKRERVIWWGVCWCLGRIHSYIMFLARVSTIEITAWSSCPLIVSNAHSTDASTVKCLKFFGPPVLSIGIKWFTVFLAGEPKLSFFRLHSWFDLFSDVSHAETILVYDWFGYKGHICKNCEVGISKGISVLSMCYLVTKVAHQSKPSEFLNISMHYFPIKTIIHFLI